MNDKMHYLNRMPNKSEFNVSNYLVAMMLFALMIIVYIYKYYPDIKSFLVFVLIFLYIGLAATTKSMKSILIKRIEATIQENNEISKKYSHIGHYMICESNITSDFYESEIKYFWVGMVTFFVLFGIAFALNSQEILTTYYIHYLYICLWIALFSLKRLNDVFNYFQRINKNFAEKIYEENDVISLPSEFEEHSNYFQRNQWKKTNKVSLISCMVFTMVLLFIVDISPFLFLLIGASSVLISLWVRLRFINKQLNSYLPILRKYDDYIKGKIGLAYQPGKDDKGYGELTDELNRDIKNIFR